MNELKHGPQAVFFCLENNDTNYLERFSCNQVLQKKFTEFYEIGCVSWKEFL